MKHEYSNLKIWHFARSTNLIVKEVTETFPSDERFNLTSQLIRAAVSVVSNIGEGSAHQSDAQFARF